MKKIKIGSREISSNLPAYIVAEIGINHNGDMGLAEKTILAAKNSGADAVKFQNYKTEDFVPFKNVEYSYISQGEIVKELQYDMFKRYELSSDQVKYLKDFCDKVGIDFHSTPTNFEGVDLLKKIGVKVLKNGSDFLTNLDLIEYMGKSGIPTVLSTGMAFISEIEEAVQAYKSSGNEELILLHCTSRYPTPAEEVNLQKIKTLRDAFGVLSGFSDHTKDSWAGIGSVIYGAAWIEKHFTLDRDLEGPDHSFSADPKEFSRYVEGIRFMENAIGEPALGPTINEMKSKKEYRLSCAAAKNLNVGHIVKEEDLIFTRPGTGVPPKNKKFLIGRKVTNAIEYGALIKHQDLG